VTEQTGTPFTPQTRQAGIQYAPLGWGAGETTLMASSSNNKEKMALHEWL